MITASELNDKIIQFQDAIPHVSHGEFIDMLEEIRFSFSDLDISSITKEQTAIMLKQTRIISDLIQERFPGAPRFEDILPPRLSTLTH